jgi:hypothetical protein
MDTKEAYRMQFDIGTIKHLGLQMYSTLPPVISELVANAWDANATKVEITIPETPIDEATSEITIVDNGIGMSDADIRTRYLIIGRDRREDENTDRSAEPYKRKIMGRKGIGKFSAFGIAREIEIESIRKSDVSRFRMNYNELLEQADEREILLPSLPPTGYISLGTKITLRHITKFRTRSIPIQRIRRGLSRRFSIIGAQYDFEIVINGTPISPEERDLKRLLEKDEDGKQYLWEYENVEIKPETGWKVSGWIGGLNRTTPLADGIDRGIVIMARGKLVQEPFVFGATVGQQFALSYLIGELYAEFVDELEDTIGTTRNSLVWETEPNIALKEWGQGEVNKIAREWAEKRRKDNEKKLTQNPLYTEFRKQADEIGNRRVLKIADTLVRQAVGKNPTADVEDLQVVIKTCLDFLEFDAFWEIAEDLAETSLEDIPMVIELFREWQIVEAKEMARVTEGRITTIEKLQDFIDKNALEVPTLHNFLKEFPWVIDPRWTLVDDEVEYSKLLHEQFPDDEDIPDEDKRIDFLCVSEGNDLIVVEIKRPKSKASMKELNQVEEYVSFMRDYVRKTTDPDFQYKEVTGYLLCGDLVDTYQVRERCNNLARAGIYIRRYSDLLEIVKKAHNEFLNRYEQLRQAKAKNNDQ